MCFGGSTIHAASGASSGRASVASSTTAARLTPSTAAHQRRQVEPLEHVPQSGAIHAAGICANPWRGEARDGGGHQVSTPRHVAAAGHLHQYQAGASAAIESAATIGTHAARR